MELGMGLRPGMTGGEIFDRGFALINKHLPNFPREFVGHGLGLGAHEQPRMNKVNRTVLEPETVYCIEYSYYHEGCQSACGWCKDKWGVSWQITPRVLIEALAVGGDEAKRAFEAMMEMTSS